MSLPHYARVPGVLVEPIGHLWAAFSPVTGETSLLNDESAAILEVLDERPSTNAEVCRELAADSGLATDDLLPTITESWPVLVEGGLVRAVNAGHSAPR